MSGGLEGAGGQGQVQVRFITNAPDIELPEGKRQLLVPRSKDPDQLMYYYILTSSDRCPSIWAVTDPQF
jgi:hypothetical protein